MAQLSMIARLRAEYADLVKNGWTDAWLVLEGDWGGQIYLTVPWRMVGEEAHVAQLLASLDREAQPVNRGEGCQAYLYSPGEREIKRSKGVPGGMGGGRLADELWLHRKLDDVTARERTRHLLGMKKV